MFSVGIVLLFKSNVAMNLIHVNSKDISHPNISLAPLKTARIVHLLASSHLPLDMLKWHKLRREIF